MRYEYRCRIRCAVLCCIALLLCLGSLPWAAAQRHHDYLTEAEIDQIRDVADQPNERVKLFQKFMDQRIDNIHQITNAQRVRDRKKQLHDLMAQFSGLADELDDNFDQYQSDHADIRKALKKLIEGSAKWPAVLSEPPDDPTYNVVRKDALDAAKDIHDSAQKLLDDQNAWFAAHPRKKEQQQQQPLIIPR